MQAAAAAAAADEWVGAFQFGRSPGGAGGPVTSQTRENGRRRYKFSRGWEETSGSDMCFLGANGALLSLVTRR